MQDPIGDCGRLGLVRDDHDRAVGQAAQQGQHGGAVFLVEVAGRLVGQDELGIVDERAGDGQALLLAA